MQLSHYGARTDDRGLYVPRPLRSGLSIVAQGGYKTNGFLAGERLHSGAILRVGAALD